MCVYLDVYKYISYIKFTYCIYCIYTDIHYVLYVCWHAFIIFYLANTLVLILKWQVLCMH